MGEGRDMRHVLVVYGTCFKMHVFFPPGQDGLACI